jgi:archaetidylinositol phosphate synthase
MTLDRLRPVADRAITPFVDVAVRVGVTPNFISVVSLAVAVGAGVAYVLAGPASLFYLVGAVLVLCNGWLDLLDGAVARETEADSAAGDLVDHVIDRYADIVIVAGLAGGIGRYALGFAAVTGVVMTSYLGTQAEAVGLDRVYGGLVGRADRLMLVGAVTFVAAFTAVAPAGYSLVAWLLAFFAVVGHLTAVQRCYYALRAL